MKLDDVMSMVDDYEAVNQNPSSNLSKFERSELYALFPEKDLENNQHAKLRWPDTYPCADESGVYFICDKDLNVLYIGRASTLGQRLSRYFNYDGTEAKGCKIVDSIDSWVREPCFIKAIAISENYRTYSLEAYLIEKVNPIANIAGKKETKAA